MTSVASENIIAEDQNTQHRTSVNSEEMANMERNQRINSVSSSSSLGEITSAAVASSQMLHHEQQHHNSTTATTSYIEELNDSDTSNSITCSVSLCADKCQSQISSATATGKMQINSSNNNNNNGTKSNNNATTLSTKTSPITVATTTPVAATNTKVEQNNEINIDKVSKSTAHHQPQQQQQQQGKLCTSSKQDYFQCHGCYQSITERYVMTLMNERWHESCLKCNICKSRLTTTCHTRNSKLYCTRDYHLIFGHHTRCASCLRPISSSEMVMRAADYVYHLDCFSCQSCSRQLKKGEHFLILSGGKLFCKLDYDRYSTVNTNSSTNMNSNFQSNNINSVNANGQYTCYSTTPVNNTYAPLGHSSPQPQNAQSTQLIGNHHHHQRHLPLSPHPSNNQNTQNSYHHNDNSNHHHTPMNGNNFVMRSSTPSPLLSLSNVVDSMTNDSTMTNEQVIMMMHSQNSQRPPGLMTGATNDNATNSSNYQHENNLYDPATGLMIQTSHDIQCNPHDTSSLALQCHENMYSHHIQTGLNHMNQSPMTTMIDSYSVNSTMTSHNTSSDGNGNKNDNSLNAREVPYASMAPTTNQSLDQSKSANNNKSTI
ncbi:LIM homeobox transcription factor 1-beta, partial [Fragariocoptes setiger]